jgi:hypothetical protein
VLALLPAPSASNGYQYKDPSNGRNISSWGGPVIRDRETGLYHMYPAEMTHHCGVNSWERNSRIVHAIAKDGAGVFTRAAPLMHTNDSGVIFPVFASEPDVARAPTGQTVMYFSMSHPGAIPPGGDECTAGCTDGSTTPECNSNYTRGQTFTTWMSHTLSTDLNNAAWSKPVVLQEGTVTSQDTNMAAVVLPNGTVNGLWRSKQYGGIHRVTATDWSDPTTYDWHYSDKPLFTEAAHPLAPEDPYVFLNKRGHWHALFHHRSCTASWVNPKGYGRVACGGMAYSVDGVQWHYADVAGTAYRPYV